MPGAHIAGISDLNQPTVVSSCGRMPWASELGANYRKTCRFQYCGDDLYQLAYLPFFLRGVNQAIWLFWILIPELLASKVGPRPHYSVFFAAAGGG